MSPSLLQLQSIGQQDLQLTQNPDISFFKYTYYKYVNFATEIVRLPMNDIASFGKKSYCDIPKQGHLLSKLFLHIRLPALAATSGDYASWCDALGYAIFSEPIELEIGGVVVDRLYPRFTDMWDDLTTGDHQLGKHLMVLKSDLYRASQYNASKEIDLMIPLEFWFTKHYASALPLLSMAYQDIRLNFKFRQFDQVINYDGPTPPDYMPIIDSSVFAEYVFLDDSIVDQFAAQTHRFAIQQVQENVGEVVEANSGVYNSTLKFNNMVQSIVFGCTPLDNLESNNYFAYSDVGENAIVQDVAFLLDGKRRFESYPEIVYRAMLPSMVHSVVPTKHIYVLPFCIKPEDTQQPSGAINISRFNDVVLSLRLQPNNPKSMLYVYALSHNIVTIENGMFTIEYPV
jgi:hypothetical protein